MSCLRGSPVEPLPGPSCPGELMMTAGSSGQSSPAGTLKLFLQPAINITCIPLLTLLFRWSLLRTVIPTVGKETLKPNHSGGPPPHVGAHRLIGFQVLPLQVAPSPVVRPAETLQPAGTLRPANTTPRGRLLASC
ncbi:unnamed protein product [Gadus morhua 'NCC']